MVVELRKRKAPPAEAQPARAKAAKTAKPKAKAEPKPKASESSSKVPVPKAGESISLKDFGGEIQTNDGETTSLDALVASSKSGVVIFTYPKASTPGCKYMPMLYTIGIATVLPETLLYVSDMSHALRRQALTLFSTGTKQACMFRDKYEPLTSGGLSIYGLSTDSPKANTTFQTKQNLPYPLLCDPSASLIGSLGLKKSPKGTVRGVFAVDKAGKVLLLQPGSPVSTVEAVEELINKDAKDESKEEEEEK
ncbi:hypothetical protein PISL3812_02600 [Talaromyces islandicus]|uniref:thioredoxin-dependent peroxiredoxin n=1 Tax=Talaromyces islandicus TaxID=28573 RepID=A0A0U1LQD7_TALIS|nr:hypothetical protein PISL3812_02600 [Talaromyces islandicus]